jgi:hypothetical protein
MLTFRQQYYFVLAIPIINVIADSIQGYFQPGLFSPGYLRALIILFFILIHFKNYYRKNELNNLIGFSLIYYFILGFFSSNYVYSQGIFLKFLIATMMFPVSYYYFRTRDQFSRLLQIMMWVLGFYVFIILISNIFGISTSSYLEDSISFGSGRVNITKTMLILVLMSPLSFRFENNKIIRKLNIFIIVVAVIFILLGVKRSAVLGLFVGYFVYFILAPQKTKVTKGLFVVGMILFLTSPLYYNTLLQRIEARQEAGRLDLSRIEEDEGRVLELRATLDAYINGSLAYKVFGAEFFNSQTYFKTTRMLHTDYATMLSGAGMLGLGAFLVIFYLILRKSLYLRNRLRQNPEKQDIIAVMIALIVAVMITGISGTVTAIGLRSIAFMFWGASFSFIDHELKLLKLIRTSNVRLHGYLGKF